MTACLKKVECERWKTLEKRISLWLQGKVQGKKKKREKVKGMTACLKKVECERMENLKKKKNQLMVTRKIQGKKNKRKKNRMKKIYKGKF